MVTISQRRRHPRWRMLFTVVILSSFVRHCELTSTKRLTDAGSSSPTATLSRSSGETRSQNLGSPNDLAWQAWLLLDSQTGAHSGMDSATFLRRITPKSVFIAPALPALPPCAEGYQADTMGRCVKNVNIDQEAHFVFLLQQLNSRYGNRGGSSDSFNNNQKKSNGPLQLNIPLLPSSNSQSSKLESEEAKDTIKIPVVVPPRVEIQSDEVKLPSKPIIGLQETKNNSKPKDGEFVFLRTDSSDSTEKNREEAPSKFGAVVPVAEFPVDDANDTDVSEIVDYNIPIDLKTLLNISSLKTINITDGQGTWKNGSQLLNSTEATPMLILLPSTATSPNLVLPSTEDLPLDDNANHQAHVRESNVTGNVTDKEIIGQIVLESTLPSRGFDVPPAVVDRIEANKTQDGNSSDILNSHVQELQEMEPFYDDEEASEDYVDGTNQPDEESSETEGGEILKHGEAGMTILLKDIKRLQNEHRQQAEAASEAKIGETSTGDLSSDSWAHSNESTTTDKEERDEAGSNVSSEVSINGDMIVETTLLDVTTDKTRNITRTLDTNSTSSIEDGDEYLRELFESEKETNPEPLVQSVHDPNEKKQPVPDRPQPAEDPKSDELEAAPSSSESLLYDPNFREHYAEEDPITEIHTIDEQSADDKEAAFLKKSKVPSSFRNFEPETNFRPTLENRHPTYPKQSVKFPSEEVNSIHSQDYKERAPYPLDDGLHSSTKSSVFAHQKPFHRGLSSWRMASRQQVSGQQVGTARRQWQRQPPISISFWTAMPLMRDPSLYSTDQDSHSKTTNSQTYTNNRFPEVTPS
ncbi:uncharacterized protein LOC117225211 isoform X1 [Megalopta genalis]|uniref:uncharacterized protein LOC117225211 isoform X1 n=1 Tax=Megalopta genalis TaxID=115081 RepID=UPI003FD35C83